MEGRLVAADMRKLPEGCAVPPRYGVDVSSNVFGHDGKEASVGILKVCRQCQVRREGEGCKGCGG
jgi:hypothetical protein